MSKWRKYLIGSWSWKRPFYSLFSIYLILLVIVLFFAETFIFPAPECDYDESLPNVSLINRSEGEQMAIWYVEAKKGQPTLLWSHGNAEDLLSSSSLLNYIHRHTGCGILAYDYPGYGISEGKPTEKSCCNAIQAAWEYLMNDKNIDESKVIIVGQSIGSGPSTWLAAQEEISASGLVLVSPFKSINRIPFGVNLFPRDRFPNINRIEYVDAPLLVLHGASDKTIRSSHGEALYQAHKGDSSNKQFVHIQGIGHNDIWGADPAYEALYDFIKQRSQ